ncbi:FAD-dependent oxidoreductase [Microbacterium sp. zg-Y818]|uniref:NAD(P)/FAD-dependent oxidoreductase n=1 Tax=unclassified Microbacterium TaxID=2609290 RepID=UPI00214B8F20|nr:MULTISPECIES: FAD-dependent oxidoreductase [unclassified Microbacterium]MCR2799356.1 FAD-dependent oxidoreductase [Microbacterium sp. zg.Y818]WIM21355.1 FAD-dependent oxidoreductase [Microbacterium sp. zg-Y818]
MAHDVDADFDTGVLIVGGGQAAVQLATTLREAEYSQPITIVGDEPHLPYSRPPLSKSYLLGDETFGGLEFRSSEFFSESDIRVLPGEPVLAVRRTAIGGVAQTASGRTITCDRLVLAVGASPRRLPIPGADADGVVTLRDADDSVRLGERLTVAQDVVVIGGGFIGLEVAASARKLGRRVTVLEAAPQLMGRAVGAETSAYYLDATRRRGIDVVLSARITGIRTCEDGEVAGVEMADGSFVPAQLVALGVGVAPRVELAEQLGLLIDNGIVVDDHSLASDGWTIAIGDCANLPSPYPVDPALTRVRLESVNNAVEQANHAARTILGTPVPYRSVPWFWSDQGDLKLQIAGLSSGHDQVIVRGDPATDRVSFLYLRQGRLIAADCVNSPADFAAVRRALAGDVRVDPRLLVDTSHKLAVVLRDAVSV